eukprot:15444335-Alexandrium_andersonii.AAC.1
MLGRDGRQAGGLDSPRRRGGDRVEPGDQACARQVREGPDASRDRAAELLRRRHSAHVGQDAARGK